LRLGKVRSEEKGGEEIDFIEVGKSTFFCWDFFSPESTDKIM
jgi:hypothetical protein